jgi:predicted nucleic acid-binding protein
VSLVLDSSVTLAWLHEDEHADGVDAVFGQLIESGAVAPLHWPLEVANSLTVAIRRNRISADQRAEFLANLARLDIATDAHTNEHAWSAALHLADLYNLTVYDAAYLELAQRLRVPLATLDKDLAAAARKAGVEVRP